MLTRSLLALGLALGSCLPGDPEGEPVLGTPDDITVAAGAYPGYRIVTACSRDAALGLIGTGTVVLATTERDAARTELTSRISDVVSVWGSSSLSLAACESGTGMSLHTNDYRDVDALVATIGTWLRERDLALEVDVFVESPPVPHAGG